MNIFNSEDVSAVKEVFGADIAEEVKTIISISRFIRQECNVSQDQAFKIMELLELRRIKQAIRNNAPVM